MYSPNYNQIENRTEILGFMRANNFAVVITANAEGGGLQPTASHLPVLVEERGAELVIVAHMAKNNPQWEQFFDDEVLVVFHGPHAYVSPRWYLDRQRVPTWNYAAVHAYGKVRAFHEPEAKRFAVAKLVAHHDPQWQADFDKLAPTYMDGMLNSIVAFEIPVSRLETRWKLSQNRGRHEMELIAGELDNSAHASERELAGLMRAHMVEK